MLRPLGLVLLLVGLAARLTAQDYRYELGGSVSSSYYLGDIGRRGLIAPQALACAVGEEVELSSESQVQQGAMKLTAPYGR